MKSVFSRGHDSQPCPFGNRVRTVFFSTSNLQLHLHRRAGTYRFPWPNRRMTRNHNEVLPAGLAHVVGTQQAHRVGMCGGHTQRSSQQEEGAVEDTKPTEVSGIFPYHFNRFTSGNKELPDQC